MNLAGQGSARPGAQIEAGLERAQKQRLQGFEGARRARLIRAAAWIQRAALREGGCGLPVEGLFCGGMHPKHTVPSSSGLPIIKFTLDIDV